MADETALDAEEEREPKSSRRWLTQIEEAEQDFKDWQAKADTLDKLYANLTALANTARDRQFQMFWANVQVLGPSIYSRPPVPVVVPRFKDRKPVPRMASELLERSTVVGFELEDIDGVMRLVRDDLTILARGCAWVRYESNEDGKGQRVCIDHADRKDFLTDPARTWKEVDWVAKRSWLTKPQMKKRFKGHPDDIYDKPAYEVRKTDDNVHDNTLKAGVWELWCKSENKVVWVTPGVDVALDDGEPHLKLEGFFPCPKPAYSTVQRRTLIPVPDMLFYKDQLEEINELTTKISALADALKVRGFYQSGSGDLSDAIEIAVKNLDPNAVLIPINNVASLSGQAFKDAVLWLPTDVIAATLVQLVELRKQVIADVYEITGLSDIMRGATDPNETLGAQELKSQYGSVRIRDRQNELANFARNLVRIAAEIMAENFSSETLLDMSQLEIETDAEIKKQIADLEKQIKAIIAQVEAAKTNPQLVQQAQQNPEQAQQILAQAQQQAQALKAQIDELNEKPTVEKVMKLLRDQRTRPFVLDIETDSTIAPDENAQKQRATEFVTAVGGFMNQVMPLIQTVPQSAKLAAETLKYVAGQFRAGRALEGTIEEFADDMARMAGQPKGPNPEQQKAQAEVQTIQQRAQMEAEKHQRETEATAAKLKLENDTATANQDREERKLAAQMEEKDRDEARKQDEQNLKLRTMGQLHEQAMEKLRLETERSRVELAKAQMPDVSADPVRPPSESIAFKDLPPEGQAQMAAQAGISITPQALASHADEQAAQRAAEKAQSKTKEPA